MDITLVGASHTEHLKRKWNVAIGKELALNMVVILL